MTGEYKLCYDEADEPPNNYARLLRELKEFKEVLEMKKNVDFVLDQCPDIGKKKKGKKYFSWKKFKKKIDKLEKKKGGLNADKRHTTG